MTAPIAPPAAARRLRKPSRRAALPVLGLVVVLAAALTAPAVGAPSLSDKQAEAARIQAEIEANGMRISSLAEQYNQARLRLDRAAGINNGLTAAELGISYLLPREVGSARAFDIMLTGRDVDADEAERIGLLSRVVPGDRLLDECYAVADRMIGYSRVGLEVTKRMLWSSLDAASLQAHMDHEGIAQLYVRLTTQNFEEAIRARRERRSPDFRD